MPNLYRIQYTNVVGEEIRCDIIQPDVTFRAATVVPVGGSVRISFDEIDDPLTYIRPAVATIELEADTTTDFSELYTDTEREWIVLIYRGSTLVFRGWLSPDGIFEDYVNSAWVISLEARDGLGDLSSKAYVDGDGNLYTGKARLRTIVQRCLERTGFTQAIRYQYSADLNANFPVEADTDVPFSSDFFEQQINQRAFLSSDGKTALSCEEVLRNIFTGINANVYSWGGEWYVNWSLQWANPAVGSTWKYNRWVDGVFDGERVSTIGYAIGSHIKGFERHWANENQRIERRPSLAATRISFDFPELEFINTNPGLDNDGSTIEGWSVNSVLTTLNDNGTVTITSGGSLSPRLTAATPLQEVGAGNIVIVTVGGGTTLYTGSTIIWLSLTISNGAETYYLDADVNDGNERKWITSATGSQGFAPYFTLGVTGMPGDFRAEVESPPVPIDGNVTLTLFGQSGAFGVIKLDYDFVGVSFREDNAAQGVDHVAERIANPSSFTEDTQQVLISDFTGAVYTGTLYRSDGTTVADYNFNRPTTHLAFPLYQTCVMDRLFIRSKPAKVFEGDIWGYMPYHAKVTIDGFPGVVWIVAGWSWNPLENITSLKLWELTWDSTLVEGSVQGVVLDDINYEKIINYGNVIEPTIKG